MPGDWIVYILIGRVMVYLGMQFPLPKILERFEGIKKLHGCDLCFGTWVYAVLAYFMGMRTEALGFAHVPILGELIIGCVTSFVVHIFIIGIRAKFEVIVI